MAMQMVPQNPLPMSVQQAASMQQLGAFIKIYPASYVRTIIGAVVFLLVAVPFFIGGLTSDDTLGRTQAVLIVFALLFFAMAIYLFYTVVQAINQRIYLFQQGIVIDKGNQVQVLPWNQVAEIWQSVTRNYRNGIYTGTTYIYTLRRADGYQIKLNNMTKHIAELGPIVAQGITRELIPRALYAIRSGQTLTFARLTVNLQGISNGREFLPWSQILAVDVKRGWVTIRRVGVSRAWSTITVAKLPNFLVFTTIANEMRRRPRL